MISRILDKLGLSRRAEAVANMAKQEPREARATVTPPRVQQPVQQSGRYRGAHSEIRRA